jgi:hypothetical protein
LVNLISTTPASTAVPITPNFDPNVFTYSGHVGVFTEELILTPFVPDGITVRINGDTLAPGADWTSPTLALGDNDFEIDVLDGDTVARSYELTISRGDPIAYLKASNIGAGDEFSSLAISADGSTLAVGASLEDSSSTGIGGAQDNDAAPDSGAVYVFTRSGTAWVQQAYVKASNTGEGDWFGWSVALSADGTTLAVGAPRESSSSLGIGGPQDNDDAPVAGATYVFTRNGNSWTQQAYIKSSSSEYDRFGWVVSLSSDGDTLAVAGTGDVNVFTRSLGAWIDQASLSAPDADSQDGWGEFLALSGDGTTLVVSAAYDDHGGTGVDASQSGEAVANSGAVYVYARTGNMWTQQAYIKASNPGSGDRFGSSVTLSDDGNTLAASAPKEDSGSAGVDGSQDNDPNLYDSGALYVFVRSSTSWSQQAYIKASNPTKQAAFGSSLSLSGDGAFLAVGASHESSPAIGIGGQQASDGAQNSGAAYIFRRLDGAWGQKEYVKASNTGTADYFGGYVALSDDGSTLVSASFAEDSADGNPNDNTSENSGAVYVYR